MLKPGDKVICIDNSYLDDNSMRKLLLNHIYIIKLCFTYQSDHFNYIILENDFEYHENRFITLKEYRKQKLLKLCSNQEISY